MRYLLLLAHGSRRNASNDEVRALAAALSERLGGRYDRVRAAFLELAEPGIPEAIDGAAAEGAGLVVLFPYFLSAGRHVREDLPRLAAEARRRHPGIDIRLEPHLGAGERLAALIADVVP